MKTEFWLDQIPLWAVCLLTVAVVWLSIKCGVLLGNRRRRQPAPETEAPIGTITAAMLGLIAFMLAFTFGIVAGFLQTRMRLLLDETNAIGTTYLRAGYLLEPHQTEMRKLIRDYVDIRVNLVKENVSAHPEKFRKAIELSELLHDQMWSHAVAIANADRASEMDALFIASLNNMIDLHNSRLTAFNYRLPPIIWNALFFITILSMATVGYQAGLAGQSSFKLGFVLAIVFATVILLIVDLDRAAEGSLRVNQQPLLELHTKLHAPAP